jgi:uncharacterized protein YbaP (TraB family)
MTQGVPTASSSFYYKLRAAALAACVSPPTCPIAAPSAIAQPFVWEARGPQGVIVLVGLHSAASPDDLPARVWTALDRSDVYVGETAEVSPTLEVPLALLRFPDDERTPLSVDERTELESLLGAKADYVARSRLWVLFMRLGETAYKFPDPTANAALRSRARRQRIEMQFFEDWFAQARFFDASITRAKLVAAMHDYPNLACEIDRRVIAFRAGEDPVFVNHIADPTDPIVARIERWLAQLEELARIHRRIFVAVGIGELLGPYGLVARLEAKGYRMQRGLSAQPWRGTE